MREKNILDVCDVRDDTGKIRPEFPRRQGSDWVPDGHYTVLRENGQRLLEITYRQGIVHGSYVDFWSNGRPACEGRFCEGKQDGCWHFYQRDGNLIEVIHFQEGKELRLSGPGDSSDDTKSHDSVQ